MPKDQDHIVKLLTEQTEITTQTVNGIMNDYGIDRHEAERMLLCTLLLQVCRELETLAED